MSLSGDPVNDQNRSDGRAPTIARSRHQAENERSQVQIHMHARITQYHGTMIATKGKAAKKYNRYDITGTKSVAVVKATSRRGRTRTRFPSAG